ncbi:hypothetical protein, variant [Aphanomyces invadans]|uniref:Uncharacterized protein n=1 Tax=Aphanomyces invadans TaxID=157072 RepID=A0A024U7U2_9STRA|nr:hypothetical protein H310_05991 [Aphanomyces invadans]XP_008869096.1 hypothetical protein, variant [Aphanomyces invadans]ETW02490.1 hypothetical protein H310_05991 [Aphanomyces invadans]ETW02491.1 hypothetical protein, variant [Aphanomyces invadans]|eukprot:XP_008869095.1 hypothetical protein H310_05991 [Aphanomyces invadans]
MEPAADMGGSSDHRKKFSLKRWVKKAWAKQRRNTEERHLKRKQQHREVKKAKPEDSTAESGLVERFNRLPTVLDNNNVQHAAASTEAATWDVDELHDNQEQDEAPLRKKSIAPLRIGVPYTDAITIENPILNNPDMGDHRGATVDRPTAADNAASVKAVCERFRRKNSKAAVPSRLDLFNQINKLPHDPREFLRTVEQRKPYSSNHPSSMRARHFDPQFTGPIAAVLARSAVMNVDDSSSDEGSSNDEWK